MKDDDTDMLNLGGQDSDSQFQSSPIGSSSAAKRARTNSTKRTRGEDAMVILAESMETVVGEQGKHIQVLANALSGVNEEVNIGRTLNKLGFSTEEIVAIALKFGQQPQLKDIFWSLEDVQKAAYDRGRRRHSYIFRRRLSYNQWKSDTFHHHCSRVLCGRFFRILPVETRSVFHFVKSSSQFGCGSPELNDAFTIAANLSLLLYLSLRMLDLGFHVKNEEVAKAVNPNLLVTHTMGIYSVNSLRYSGSVDFSNLNMIRR
ncbi:hypothetical protein PIB30_102222 [Stylosanthes scabra]|uniref:Uncharacterized protein n=1 Tax=Stylosanthes scabra TaxID=79078 RepID=A0ABU6WXI9_9FABA|nr:hypothetical protein [Stylosanthes scabra]